MALHISSPGQGPHPAPQAPSSILDKLPEEVIIELMRNMGPETLNKFGATNRHYNGIWSEYWREFHLDTFCSSPERELLVHLIKADSETLDQDKMLRPLVVTFSPNLNDASEYKICKSPVVYDRFGNVVQPRKFRLDAGDLEEMIDIIKVIDWWVEMYPRLRWREEPGKRRSLYSAESERLRLAIARWWLYNHYFHLGFDHSNKAAARFSTDSRLKHIRVLTTQEIYELKHFLNTMSDVVSKDLCSTPDRRRRRNQAPPSDRRIPWGKTSQEQHAIVSTYMKLGPELLKYFLENCYGESKATLVTSITNSTRDLFEDQESLSFSIQTVIEEREMLGTHPLAIPPRMGIVKEDRDNACELEAWNHDAWPSGFPHISCDHLAHVPVEHERRIPTGKSGLAPVHDGPKLWALRRRMFCNN
ncbi:hypothetical protein F4861DRAFT_207096 [Xylaria intraflava]|nr:hypothetical protein F4861DRAFT_207096 [Xylaria intraflava]